MNGNSLRNMWTGGRGEMVGYGDQLTQEGYGNGWLAGDGCGIGYGFAFYEVEEI